MSDTNVNLSAYQLAVLSAERLQRMFDRKARNRRRYLRQYMRRGGFTRVLMVRLSDIVTVTIGPLSAVTYPIDALGLI